MAKFKRGANLNKDYIPTKDELPIVSRLANLIGSDYRLIRCTETMLEKSIIDASGQLRELFLKNDIIDFSQIGQGKENKVIKNIGVIVTVDGIRECKVSFYRPNSKQGDPRFWFYNAKKHLVKNKLVFISCIKGVLIGIPVIEDERIFELIKTFIGSSDSLTFIERFRTLYQIHKGKWIQSVSPYKSNPKDVGETLESIIGLKANSSINADIDGLIEIKSKREQAGTNDSLFSKTPNWKISPINSSREMILSYGYESETHPGFLGFYITVDAIPRNQGLWLSNNNSLSRLEQVHQRDGLTCIWEHSVLRHRLMIKHPNTIWVKAEEKRIGGKIHFRYQDEMSFTSNPIFTQFLTLIESSIIKFDWRGKVKPDGSGYRDHGHGFRISPKNRALLFDEEIVFTI